MFKAWHLGFIYLAVASLFYPAFTVFFSQDDFFHFQASLTDGSTSSFIKLFGFPHFADRGYAFYRPLFREGLYNIYYSVFGLNVIPFRTFSFFLHFVNISLVYVFIQTLFRNKSLALFSAFFFGITSANLSVLYYLAGGIETSGLTLFLLLTLMLFYKYLENKKHRYKLLSFVAFLLSLTSHEISVVIPFLLFGLLYTKVPFKNLAQAALKELWPFLLILAIFAYLDAVQIGFLQTEQQYHLTFSFKVLVNSLVWYSLWAFGLPETLIDFVGPGLKLNPSLMRYWGDSYSVIFPTFLAGAFFVLSGLVYLVIKSKTKIFCDKRLNFLLAWFFLTLGPVIFLPLHRSTHYLAPALPAFWATVGFLFFSFWEAAKRKDGIFAKILLSLAVITFVVLNITTIKLEDKVYWAASRGRIAWRLLREVKNTYPTLRPGSGVYFKNDPSYPYIARDWGGSSKQASLVLNNEDAIKLYYKDVTLRTFYEDLGGIPEGFPSEKVVSLVAKVQIK